MGGRIWTEEEVVTMVYFASRKVDHEGVSKILTIKLSESTVEPRTVLAIRSKLDGIRGIEGLWSSKDGWNIHNVDQWLIGRNVPNLQTCISFGEAELAMVSDVRFMSINK